MENPVRVSCVGLSFKLGDVYITRDASDLLAPGDAAKYLIRHASCDWGDVCEEDWKLNDMALKAGDRLLSSYAIEFGCKIWIITEADRSSTTILTPEEY